MTQVETLHINANAACIITAVDLQSIVRSRATPGPIAYQAVMGLHPQTQVRMCKECLAYARRLRRRRRRKPTMLPLDAVVLEMMVPGLPVRQQDSRTRWRIYKTILRDSGNAFYGLWESMTVTMPVVPVQRHSNNSSSASAVIVPPSHQWWWDYNLQTLFFATKGTARVMRQRVASA